MLIFLYIVYEFNFIFVNIHTLYVLIRNILFVIVDLFTNVIFGGCPVFREVRCRLRLDCCFLGFCVILLDGITVFRIRMLVAVFGVILSGLCVSLI